jgi:hypothetical protein
MEVATYVQQSRGCDSVSLTQAFVAWCTSAVLRVSSRFTGTALGRMDLFHVEYLDWAACCSRGHQF